MTVTLYLPKPLTPARRLEAVRAPGRPSGRAPGGWLADKIALARAILLCWRCDPRWNPKRAGYERFRLRYQAQGECDGCGQYVTGGQLYIPEALHDTQGEARARRRGRWGTSVGWLPYWLRGR